MPPKPAPGKNVPTKNPPQRVAQQKSTRGLKGGTGKKTKEKQKGHRLKLKGWLETKADWVKFDAWAEINALPRKIPEPEPVVRASKPLSQMKKRIAILSKPQPDISKPCRFDLRVSKKALTAKPSKRIIELAMCVVRNIDDCRELPMKISGTALRYKATKRIIEISRPQFHFSEFCKFLASSQSHTENEETSARTKRLALAKKAIECPDFMTDDEINILMTSTGIYRSALNYKITPWVAFLAIPSYRLLKYQTDDQAEEWKKLIVEESETRGKKALESKKKKEEKSKKREEDAKKLDEKKDDEKINDEEKPAAAEVSAAAEEDKENATEDAAPEEMSEAQGNETNEPADTTEDTAQDSATNDEKNNEESLSASRKAEPKESTKEVQKTAEEEEAEKRRKAEKNAWRFTPPPCIDDPFEIKRSALKGKVPPRMEELAKPRVRKDGSCKKNPFEVRKSALDGPVPERMTELAKPSHPRDPVERPPPREKDPYGRPIIPMPPYGKKMPRVKPYQEAECPDKDEKVTDEEEKKNNGGKKRRAIDPIVYEATIDPCIDPERSKRQLKARKAAKEEIEKKKKTEETAPKEDKPQEPDTTD